MTAATVTPAYLQGIREGRETLRFLLSVGFTKPEAISHSLESCRGVQALGFCGEMAEFNRGQRDFWSNQSKGN